MTGRQGQAPLELAIGLVWAALGLATFVAAILIGYLGASSGLTPIVDQWAYINPQDYLPHLFKLHNGAHPIALGLLLFAFDYHVFGASGWFVQAFNFLALAGQALAFVLLARIGGVRSIVGTLIVSGFAVTMIFTPLGEHSLGDGFQFTFLLTFCAAVGAACALASYATAPRAWTLALSVACSLIAMLSLANGVLISVLLVPLALVLRLPRHAILAHAAIVILAGAVLFGPWAERGPTPGLGALPQALHWSIFLLGAPLGRIPPLVAPGAQLNAEALSFGFGLAVLAASAAFLAFGALRKQRDPAFYALATIVIFILASALMIGAGRAYLGPSGALASRYIVVATTLIVALALGLALLARDASAAWRYGLLSLGTLACVAVPISTSAIVQAVVRDYQTQVLAQTALVVRAPDPVVGPVSMFQPMPELRRQSESIRPTHTWHFRDAWAHLIGSRRNFAGLPTCPGAVNVAAVNPAGARRRYLRVEGWVDGDAARHGRSIIMATTDGEILGYGRVWRDASDLVGNIAFNPDRRQWSGHALVSAENIGLLTAYLAEDRGVKCRLEPSLDRGRADRGVGREAGIARG